MLSNSKDLKVNFSHVPSLDGLRGIAVLAVMVYHLELISPDLASIFAGGFLGVDVFFVLSGFLITSILLKEHSRTGTISLAGFYFRRTLRLIPAFWLFLLVLFFGGGLLLPAKDATIIYSENNFVYSLTYLMNWHRATGALTGNLNHTWSLAIEEQFYIAWSLLAFAAYRVKMSRKQIIAGTSFVIATLLIQRAIRTAGGTNVFYLYYSTETRIDAILIGCLTSMIYCWKMIPTRILESKTFDRMCLGFLLLSAAIMLGFQYEDRLLYFGILSLFSASIAASVLWLVTRERSRIHAFLELRVLRWIGQISYGLYLWHYLSYGVAKSLVNDTTAQIVLGIGLAFSASVLSFYFLERPISWLKEFRIENVGLGTFRQTRIP